MKHIYMRWLLSAVVAAFGTGQVSAQITLHEATNVTQTKATLSADFPDLSVEHGFQYKYGILPEIDDFSRTALAPSSEPVNISTTGTYAWSARTAKGWVESNMQVPVGQASSMSAEITSTEPTPISFEWSVDSEDNIGLLSFIVDGETIGSITGLVDFEKFTYTLPEGTHIVEWQYKKSASTSMGLDLAKVKNITFANATPGEWISVNTNTAETEISTIYPNQNYLFRAYENVLEETNYSKIGTFKTLDFDYAFSEITVDPITQTKATINSTFNLGNNELRPKLEISTERNGEYYYSGKNATSYLMNYSETALLSGSSRGSCYGYDGEDGKYLYTNFSYNITGFLYGCDINVKEPFRIKFEWGAKGVDQNKAKIYFSIDEEIVGYYEAKSDELSIDSFEYLIDAGYHSISWGGDGTQGQFVRFGNCILERASSWYKIIEPNELSSQISLNELLPKHKYQIRSCIEPGFESQLEKRWENQYSDWIYFITEDINIENVEIKDIKQSSVTLLGYVEKGDAELLCCGLQYKATDSNRWVDYPKEVDSSKISQTITRLKPDSEYEYRIYAQPNQCDTVFGDIVKFKTLPVIAYKPEILRVAQHEATLQGKVIFGDANIYQRGMQFRKKGDAEWEEVEDAGNDSIYTLVRKNLEMGASYEARTYVQPAGCDIIYSDILEFKTLDSYFSSFKSDIQTYSTITLDAVLSSVIDEDIHIDEYGFECNIYFIGFQENSDIITIPVTPDGVNLKTTVTGLVPSSRIICKAYVIINGQKYYDLKPVNVETKDVVIKVDPIKITPTSISLNLKPILDGEITISQIEYALREQYEYNPDCISCGNELVIQNLKPNTEYLFWFRSSINGKYIPLYADWGDGTIENPIYFTTLPIGINVKFSDITQTKTKMKISIDAGDAEVTDIQYKLSSGKRQNYSGEVVFSGLTPATKYSVDVWATINGKEYSWTANQESPYKNFSFTTKTISAYLSVSDVQQTSAKFSASFSYGDATVISSGVIIGGMKYENVNDGIAIELLPATKYECKSYVETKENGMKYSSVRTIITKSIYCESLPVSNISNRSATMNGVIDCDANSSAEFGFQCKKMTGWNSDPAFTKGHKLDDGAISVALVNGMLDPDTDYQYRPAVRYQDKIYYAPTWTTFRTEQEFVYYPASVYTLFRTDRENNALVLCGYYVAGSESVVSQGYEYWRSDRHSSRAEAPASPLVVTTDESMQYVFNPGDLPNGDYKVRAFVKTESGNTIYGSTVGFTASNSGYSGIEDIAYDEPEIKVENAMVKIYNADGLECNIYALTGVMVASHRISGDCYEIALTPNSFYIVHLSNGLVRKIRL